MDDALTLQIRSDVLSADIATTGAELQNLRDAAGRLLQWTGDPAFWTGRAPILFPIVGMLRDGRYRLGREVYALPKHGFARHAAFDVVAQSASAVSLRLQASDATRAVYPFEFELGIGFALRGNALRVTASIANHGATPMPASLGFHPALAWPLPYDRPRADHGIRFARDEPAPVRRIDGDGLLRPDPQPTPVEGDLLMLRDDLFVDDALIFDRLASRHVRYGASSGPCLDIRFDDMPMLGVWTKPGAGFVCIEPWQGVADPVGFDGDLFDKPGIVVVAPGAARTFSMTIALDAHASR